MQVRHIELECKELNPQEINNFIVPALKQAPEGTVFSLDLSACRINCEPQNALAELLECISSYRFDSLNLKLTQINQACLLSELVRYLGQNPKLRELDLSHNEINDEQFLVIFEALKNNTELENLKMSHNALSKAIIPKIRAQKLQHPSRKRIDFAGNQLSEKDILTAELALRNTRMNKAQSCNAFFYAPSQLPRLADDVEQIIFSYI